MLNRENTLSLQQQNKVTHSLIKIMIDNVDNGLELEGNENEYNVEANQDYIDESIGGEKSLDGLENFDEPESVMAVVDKSGDLYAESTIITCDDNNEDDVARAHEAHIDIDANDDYNATVEDVEVSKIVPRVVDSVVGMSDGDDTHEISEVNVDKNDSGTVEKHDLCADGLVSGQFISLEDYHEEECTIDFDLFSPSTDSELDEVLQDSKDSIDNNKKSHNENNKSSAIYSHMFVVDDFSDEDIDINDSYHEDHEKHGKGDVKITSPTNVNSMLDCCDFDNEWIFNKSKNKEAKAKFFTEKFLNDFKNNKAVQAIVPHGYVPNLPIVTSVNGELCLRVPLMRYKVTGVVDNTLVYPVKYVITVTIPQGTIINYEDLTYNGAFVDVDFNNPVGIFRHDAVKNLNKEEYAALRSKLFVEYDKMIDFLANNAEYTEANKQAFMSLLNQVLEPSLKPLYHAIDNSFATRFLR